MALFNVTTQNNTLLATAYTANAVSEIVTQDAGDNDFESVRDTRVHWRLANISDQSLSSTDHLVSTSPLQDGDRILVRLNDGSIRDAVASGVTSGTAPVHAPMTSNTLPAGEVMDSDGSTDAWKAFDGDNETQVAASANAGDWYQYQFENNTPQTIYTYYIATTQYSSGYAIQWVIEGSLDGTNWATISTEQTTHGTTYAGQIFQIESPGEFSYYRLRFTYINQYVYLKSFHLLDGTGSTMDTTAITNGEVPDQVFKFTDQIFYNGSPAIEKDVFYEYGTTGTKLAVISQYHDVLVGGRTLETKINFTAASNEVVEITGQVYKAV